MKTHLNTLFVTTQGAYLAKEGENVTVRIENEVRLRVPVHTLDGVVCFGNVGMSPFLMGHCSERGLSVSFLTENGRFLARVCGAASGNVLLRREQYRRADNPEATRDLAAAFVTGKLINTRTLLQRMLRDHRDKLDGAALDGVVNHLAENIHALALPPESVDSVRGLEGDAANCYFGVFDHLLLHRPEAFAFSGRNRRPPLDRINCLLSFLYTVLYHDVRSALESTGLDPSVGFLHRDRPGRHGLALDLMEEFRPVLVDRLVLNLVNLGQVAQKQFDILESGAVVMKDDLRKAVLVAYQTRKQEVVQHPFTKEKMSLGLVPHMQARLLARHLRGDLDGYPPFIRR